MWRFPSVAVLVAVSACPCYCTTSQSLCIRAAGRAPTAQQRPNSKLICRENHVTIICSEQIMTCWQKNASLAFFAFTWLALFFVASNLLCCLVSSWYGVCWALLGVALTSNHVQAAQATFKSIKSLVPLLDRVLVQRFKPDTVRSRLLLRFIPSHVHAL